jgi:hypothetical protein
VQFSFSKWERIPWYLRTTIETLGIIILISLGIASTPELRSIYEKIIEHKMGEFKEAHPIDEPMVDHIEPITPPLPEQAGNSTRQESSQEELISETETDDTEEEIQVGRSQLWRFTIKTVSPDELRPQVVQALTELEVPINTPGLGGMQVPGGIEFDLILSQSLVPDIKKSLQKLASQANTNEKEDQEPSKNSHPFSWYKVKSRRTIPFGKSQVVIWLSQPNS